MLNLHLPMTPLDQSSADMVNVFNALRSLQVALQAGVLIPEDGGNGTARLYFQGHALFVQFPDGAIRAVSLT